MNPFATEASISKDPIVGLVKLASSDEESSKLAAIAGVANYDDGSLIVPEAIKQAAQEIIDDGLNMAYTPSSGLKGLANLLIEEICGKKVLEELAQESVSCSGVVTAGGTHAISTSIVTCSNESDVLISHNPHWPGFDSITLGLKRKPLVTFEILDEKHNFNLASLEETVEKHLDTKSKIILLINTPYDNPMGKDFSGAMIDLAKYLADILVRHPNQEILLILDTAYVDFGPGGKNYGRLKFLIEFFKIINGAANPNFNLVIAGSLSKSFSMYGARVGVAALLSSNKDAIAKWVDTAGGTIRGSISNNNRFNQELALKVLQDYKKLANVHETQKSTTELISKRTDFLFKKLESANLPAELEAIKPDGGFFTSFKLTNAKLAEEISKKLIEDHTYVPVISGNYIRIPTCSLKEEILDQLIDKVSSISKGVLSR